MGFQLAKGERIVKEYNFGSGTSSGLTVTNMRLVSQMEGHGAVVRKEIPLSSADYVSTAIKKGSRSIAPFIVFLVLAVAFAVLAYFSPLVVTMILNPMNIVLDEAAMNYIAIGIYGVAGVFAILALVNLVLFLAKKSTGVEIVISGKCLETELLCASSSTGGVAKTQPLQFTVNRKVAEALMNELGALLLDLKSGHRVSDSPSTGGAGEARTGGESHPEHPSPAMELDLDKPIPEDIDDDTPIPESVMEEPIPGK